MQTSRGSLSPHSGMLSELLWDPRATRAGRVQLPRELGAMPSGLQLSGLLPCETQELQTTWLCSERSPRIHPATRRRSGDPPEA